MATMMVPATAVLGALALRRWQLVDLLAAQGERFGVGIAGWLASFLSTTVAPYSRGAARGPGVSCIGGAGLGQDGVQGTCHAPRKLASWAASDDLGAVVDREWETRVRLTAFEHLRRLREENTGAVPSGLLEERLRVDGVPVAIMSRQKGIHKPAELSAALTLKTSVSGRYDDRIDVGEAATVRYRYRDPSTQGSRAIRMAEADNRAVRAAMSNRLPVAYLMGVDKGWYLPFAPVNVIHDDEAAREFTVDLTEIAGISLEGDHRLPEMAAEAPVRQYQVREVKYRVHQARFRQMVLKAYRAACAMCELRHAELLDAAHIVDDAGGGEPHVSNGIALCKIHHAAFDRHILGVQPDRLTIHVRDDVLVEVDGPMLRYGLQSLHGRVLRAPRRRRDRPGEEALAARWRRFRIA